MPLTRADAEAWLDGYLPYALERGNIAGAVVVIVKDGQVLLQKGYGYADVGARKPVDPETTMFRPGSVSKLFTWTAVMQQVEQGKIDLDHDVNEYLDFKIPPFQGKPVTMRNLMTHTGGFEEWIKNLIGAEPTPEIPLRTMLTGHVPGRIFPPGQVPAYSNFGATLAGYIVQRVSGQTFDDYVDQHIFAPLDMQHASFREPLPPNLAPLMSKAYELASGPPKPFEIVHPAPAGSSAVTGADMAHFLIAHLQDGEYHGQAHPAGERPHRRCTTRRRRSSRRCTACCSVSIRWTATGIRSSATPATRAGSIASSTSIPDDHVGVFVSLNSLGSGGSPASIRHALYAGFTDRYFPGPGPQGHVDPATARADAAKIAGHYLSSRREQTNFLSLLNLIGQAKISADADGHITASNVLGVSSQPKQFEEIAPFVWREIDGKERLAAKLEGGAVTMWGEDSDSAVEVSQPAPWYENAGWLLPAVIAAVAALLLTGLLWPVTAIVRRQLPQRLSRCEALPPTASASSASPRWPRDCSCRPGSPSKCTCSLPSQVSAAMDPAIMTLHVLSIVLFPLAVLAALWDFVVIWRTRAGWGSWWARLWSTVLLLSSIVLAYAGVLFPPDRPWCRFLNPSLWTAAVTEPLAAEAVRQLVLPTPYLLFLGDVRDAGYRQDRIRPARLGAAALRRRVRLAGGRCHDRAGRALAGGGACTRCARPGHRRRQRRRRARCDLGRRTRPGAARRLGHRQRHARAARLGPGAGGSGRTPRPPA